MALDPNTTSKLSSWYDNYLTKQSGAPSAFSTEAYKPTTIGQEDLTKRTVGGNETVAGQMQGLLSSGSPYIEGARQRAVRQTNGRGLLNSSIAASAGEDAAVQAALPIASQDATTYGAASEYNTKLSNQATMYNADTKNKINTDAMAIDADTAKQVRGLDASRGEQILGTETQMDLANISQATSKYSTDANTTDRKTTNTTTLTNNIIANTELAPDIKAALLRELGQPGLASAIYVVNSVAADLAPDGGTQAAAGQAPASSLAPSGYDQELMGRG